MCALRLHSQPLVPSRMTLPLQHNSPTHLSAHSSSHAPLQLVSHKSWNLMSMWQVRKAMLLHKLVYVLGFIFIFRKLIRKFYFLKIPSSILMYVPCILYSLLFRPTNAQYILYIKMNVCFFACLFVCMYGTYTNSHFWTNLNQTFHTSPPWSGRDHRVCMDPKFLTSLTFWVIFL